MNDENFKIVSEGKLLSNRYVKQAAEAKKRRENYCKSLLSQRGMPAQGWDDSMIELIIRDLSMMDSNNFLDNVGMGEREGRVYSSIVSRRHFGLMHGVGRSGDLMNEQPKAAGSSLMSKIAHFLAIHALKISGLTAITSAVILPTATGQAIAQSLSCIAQDRPGRKKVIWTRIDQKTCLKAICASGLTPVVIENVLEGDELRTNIDGIRAAIAEDSDGVCCVVSTNCCFAPRAPEKVCEVAMICKDLDIPHLVNNAYGTQCPKAMKELNNACVKGRVDGVIQSTDKNYMVPVGGSILACAGRDSTNKTLVDRVSSSYPGRASNAAIVDLFVTLLSMGQEGYRSILDHRCHLFEQAQKLGSSLAAAHGERLLITPHNGISMAMTLDTFVSLQTGGAEALTALGGMLFARVCSGSRVVSCVKHEKIAGISFEGYGSHCSNYPHPYVAFAVALGATSDDVVLFFKRLNSALKDFRKQLAKYAQTAKGISTATHVSPFPASSLKLINEESDTYSVSGSSCSSHTTEAGATLSGSFHTYDASAISGSATAQPKSTFAAAPSAHSDGSREEAGGRQGSMVNGENRKVKEGVGQARNAAASVVAKRDVPHFRSEAFPKKGGSGSGKHSDCRSGNSEGESMGLETGIIKVTTAASTKKAKSYDAAGIRGLVHGEGDEEKKQGKLSKMLKSIKAPVKSFFKHKSKRSSPDPFSRASSLPSEEPGAARQVHVSFSPLSGDTSSKEARTSGQGRSQAGKKPQLSASILGKARMGAGMQTI